MKRFFSLFLSFVLLFAVCACSREKNLTELEEIQQQLAEMEGYACTATLMPATTPFLTATASVSTTPE